jgi:hypothetical protein
MSVRQAQEVAARLESLGVRWNGAFAGGPAATGDSVELPGGMRITLLSPAAADVSRFVDMWDAETQRGARSRPDEPQEDTSEKAIADTTAVERPVLYVTNAPEDDLWRARLLDALRPLVPDAALLSGDLSEPDAWQRADRADRARPRVAVVLLSEAGLASTFAHEQISALVDAVTTRDLLLTWLLVGPCSWEATPLVGVTPLHEGRKALAQLPESEAGRAVTRAARSLATLAGFPPGRQKAARRPRGTDDGPIDVESLAGRPFVADRSIANNASLAFLAEQHGTAFLVGGDASARTLTEAVRVVLRQRGTARLRLDAFVVPHNGNAANLDRDLLQLLDCDRYLISTNGAVFHQPNRETIARILAYGRSSPKATLTLVFNYRTPQTAIWDDPELKARWNYQTVFPSQNGAGITVRI